MNERIRALKDYALKREYKCYRNERKSAEVCDHLIKKLHDGDMSDIERMTYRFVYLMKNEEPMILDDERIVFVRTITGITPIYSDFEMSVIKANHYIHELGYVCNICPDYGEIIEKGLAYKRSQIVEIMGKNDEQSEYGQCLIKCIDAILDLSDRYHLRAKEMGRMDVSSVFKKIPRQGAVTFQEALQFFRILHFSLWISGSYHNVIGRFDQYMYKYYKHDIDIGTLNKDEALELLEEFFISFNRDSDLYPGVQQGDNGQSIVLGGYIDKDVDGFNELSGLCLQASLNVSLIDPKINLRVNKLTPLSIYRQATWLTKKGLGFPQYSNDDVVIDGLTGLGYEYEDAVNYVVAACWEFIVPGRAMDIPNIGALSFLGAVNKCTREKLKYCDNFAEFFESVKTEIDKLIKDEVSKFGNLYIIPSPVMTLFHNDNIKLLSDISYGAEYNNYGMHGTGISNAVDAVYAIKKHIFDDKDVTADMLLSAMEVNFEGHARLRNILKYNTVKMGMDEDETDSIATELLDFFAKSLKKYTNERGGIYRGGTGSAMYYIWHARNEFASADGRLAGEPLSANFSPSLDISAKNPLSTIKSFTKADMKKVINGGPLTLELHDTVFRNDDGIEKTAVLVSEYIKRGGHQLQINAVNKQTLMQAQRTPNEYKNLIVRVWGWSGYFVELDKEYQDQIIKRTEYNYSW